MNNLEPFEEHLADQFQQIPVPSREEGWIEMRKLLDRELPEGGTAWSGNRKWWWMGITVAIIIAGLWMSEEFHKKVGSETQNVAVDKSRSSVSQQPSSNETNKDAQNPNTPTNDKATAGISNNKKSNDISEKNVEDKNPRASDDHDNSANPASNNSTENVEIVRTNSKLKTSKGNSTVVNLSAASGIVFSSGSSKKDHLPNSRSSAHDATQNSSTSTGNGFEKNNQAELEIAPSTSLLSEASAASSEIFFSDPGNELSTVSTSLQPIKAEPGKTDKAFAKQMRKRSVQADNRKISARNMRGDMREKDQDLTFAAGLALPQSFAIASQQSPSYGVNATASRVSDYLPVPFFQYHMNSKLFLQTELQFQSPQYTDRLLVSQKQQQITPSSTLQNNIFIEKLYYFHIPFNVYFSPMRNFYIGSGLQFSSLLSGVATYETNHYNGSTLENTYSKVEGFRDDTIASKLSSSEWRYQFDANYYFKRFTFGARYNQAFSQFVNLQPSPTLPYTQAKNQSFFIYLRYNIWEERRKGSFYSE